MRVFANARPAILAFALSSLAAIVSADEKRPDEAHSDRALPPVVVTASGRPQPRDQVIASVELLDRETLDRFASGSLADLLRGVSGVRAYGSGSTEYVALRGFSQGQTLVLVDGMRRVARFGGQNLAALPIEAIERIEIIRGPASALYGADAMGGVINIITRKPAQGGLEYSRLSYGTADGGGRETWIASGGLGVHGDRGGLMLRYERRERDPLGKDPSGADLYNRQRLDAIEANAFFELAEGHRLEGLIERHDQDDFGRRYQPPRGPRPGFLWQGVERDLRRTAGLRYRGEWGDGLGASLALSRSSTDGAARRQPDLLEETDFTLDQLEGRLHLPIGDATLTAGAGFLREDLAITITSRVQSRNAKHGLIQYESAPARPLSFIAGLRLDRYSDFGEELTPRIGALWRIGDELALRLNAGSAFRAPSAIEQYASFVRGTSLIRGTPGLKPERARFGEASLEWRPGAWLLELDLYEGRVRNLIRALNTGERQGPLNVLAYRNIDRARLRGAELRARYALSPAFDLAGSWEWLSAKDLTTGQRLLGSIRQRINLDASWRLQAGRIGLRAHRLVDYFNRPSPAVAPFDENYLRLDLYGEWRLREGLRAFAAVDNLLDRRDPLAASLTVTSDPGTRYLTVGLRWSKEEGR